MVRALGLHIDLDKVLFSLLCCYALSMPFELILEIFFDIDTILKPFRFFALLILSVYGLKVLKTGLKIDIQERNDWVLYGVFLYGIIISCFRIFGNYFNISLFYNDLFLVGLNVSIYFVYKSIKISREQALKIFNFFIAGVFLNAFYINYLTVSGLASGRLSGFTDNPNYASFGIVAAVSFLLLKTAFIQKKSSLILYLLMILVLLFTFGTQGSRTGFVMLMVAVFLIFFMVSLWKKILIIASGLFIVLFLSAQEKVDTGPMVLFNRLNNTLSDDTEDVRFVVWRGMFNMFEQTGYGGMGIGQFKANFTKYYADVNSELILEIVYRGYYLSPHNDYLAILADYGLPSLLLYVLFLFLSIRKKWFEFNIRKIDTGAILLSQFTFVFLLCIAIFGLAAENFQHQIYWFLLMFVTKDYT